MALAIQTINWKAKKKVMKFELIQVKKLKDKTLAPVINRSTALIAITIAPISLSP